MKISIAICVLFFINNSLSFVIKPAECPAVRHSNDPTHFNQYITNEMRSKLCASKITNYNSHGKYPTKYLGEEYNYNSHQNPCQVVCRYDPTTESVHEEPAEVENHEPQTEEHVVDHSHDVESHFFEDEVKEVQPMSYAEYHALPFFEARFDAHNGEIGCGFEHVCNLQGCCVQIETKKEEEHVEEPVEEPKEEVPVDEVIPEEHEPKDPEHEEPKDPEHEHKDPEEPKDPEHEHKDPEEPKEPEEPKDPEHEHKDPEEPKEPVEHEHEDHTYLCEKTGYFRDPADPHSFYRCSLSSAHYKCATGLKFDEEKSECMEPEGHKPEEPVDPVDPEVPVDPVDPEVPAEPVCEKEGYFRHPSNCHKFYRCYHNDETERDFLRIAHFQCRDTMFFDETAETCVILEHKEQCEAKKPEEPKVEVKEPDYDKPIKCTAEGYFRNEYNCHRFYRCYNQADVLRVSFQKCQEGLVFDETVKVCVNPHQSTPCENKAFPAEYL